MRKENINFVASVYAPNPKEVVYWIDLKEGPDGLVIKTYSNGKWVLVNEADTSGSDQSLASLTNRVTTLESSKLDASVYNAFVSEVSEVHNDLEDSKANKATTLSGYGITDVYTKSDIDGKGFATTTLLNSKVSGTGVTNMQVVTELPESPDANTLYIITAA